MRMRRNLGSYQGMSLVATACPQAGPDDTGDRIGDAVGSRASHVVLAVGSPASQVGDVEGGHAITDSPGRAYGGEQQGIGCPADRLSVAQEPATGSRATGKVNHRPDRVGRYCPDIHPTRHQDDAVAAQAKAGGGIGTKGNGWTASRAGSSLQWRRHAGLSVPGQAIRQASSYIAEIGIDGTRRNRRVGDEGIDDGKGAGTVERHLSSPYIGQ